VKVIFWERDLSLSTRATSPLCIPSQLRKRAQTGRFRHTNEQGLVAWLTRQFSIHIHCTSLQSTLYNPLLHCRWEQVIVFWASILDGRWWGKPDVRLSDTWCFPSRWVYSVLEHLSTKIRLKPIRETRLIHCRWNEHGLRRVSFGQVCLESVNSIDCEPDVVALHPEHPYRSLILLIRIANYCPIFASYNEVPGIALIR